MTFTVVGMTCGHCVAAVTHELGKIANVRDINVDLADGAVTVQTDGAVDLATVEAAVSEAGYAVAAGS